MLKILSFIATVFSSTVVLADNCALDFNSVEGLHVHQRVGLENGRTAGFTIRIFAKTVGGLARVIAIAGQAPRETAMTDISARSMTMAFPELGLTRLTQNLTRKMPIPHRSEQAAEAALREESVAKAAKALTSYMRREKITLLKMVRMIQSDQVDFLQINISKMKRDVIERLAGRTRAPLAPAKQLRFDLEKGYVTPTSLVLRQALYAEARRMAVLGHRAFFYLASGLIGAGAASWIWGNPHLAWLSAGGAGVLAAQVGVIMTLKFRPTEAVELRARDAYLSRTLDKILAEDRDIDEMLILTEQNRVHGLGVALERAGFTEIKAANQP